MDQRDHRFTAPLPGQQPPEVPPELRAWREEQERHAERYPLTQGELDAWDRRAGRGQPARGWPWDIF